MLGDVGLQRWPGMHMRGCGAAPRNRRLQQAAQRAQPPVQQQQAHEVAPTCCTPTAPGPAGLAAVCCQPDRAQRINAVGCPNHHSQASQIHIIWQAVYCRHQLLQQRQRRQHAAGGCWLAKPGGQAAAQPQRGAQRAQPLLRRGLQVAVAAGRRGGSEASAAAQGHAAAGAAGWHVPAQRSHPPPAAPAKPQPTCAAACWCTVSTAAGKNSLRLTKRLYSAAAAVCSASVPDPNTGGRPSAASRLPNALRVVGDMGSPGAPRVGGGSTTDTSRSPGGGAAGGMAAAAIPAVAAPVAAPSPAVPAAAPEERMKKWKR